MVSSAAQGCFTPTLSSNLFKLKKIGSVLTSNTVQSLFGSDGGLPSETLIDLIDEKILAASFGSSPRLYQ